MSEEKLSIGLGVDVDGGALDGLMAALDNLSSQLGGITGKLGNATRAVDGLGDEAAGAARATDDAADALGDMGKEAGKTKGALGKLGDVLNGLKGLFVGAFTVNALMNAGQQINALNQAVRQTGVDAQSFQVLRESAQAAGVDFGELSQGVSSFQRALNSDTEQSAAVFRKLGVAMTDSTGKIRDTSELLQETGAALKNMSDKGAAAALAEQIGLSREMTDAISQTGEEWESLQKKVADGRALTQEDMDNSEQFRKTYSSILLQLQQITEKLFAALAPVFTTLLSGLKPVIDMVGGVIRVIAGLITFVHKMTGGWWLAVPAIYAVIKLFPMIVKGLNMIKTALLTNPLFWIASVIIGIILVVEDLYVWLNGGESVIGKWLEGWGIFPEDVKAMIEKVKGYFLAAWDFITKQFKLVVKIITSLFTGDFQGAWDAIKQFASNAWEAIKAIFSPVINWFGDKFDAVGRWMSDSFDSACQSVSQFFSDLWDGIKAPFVAAWDWIKGLFTSGTTETTSSITEQFDAITELLKAPFQAVGDFLGSVFTNPLEEVKKLFSGDFGNIGEAITKRFTEVVDRVKKLFSGAWNFIKGIFSDSNDELEAAAKSADQVEREISRAGNTISTASSTNNSSTSNVKTSNYKIEQNFNGNTDPASAKKAVTDAVQAASSMDLVSHGGAGV